MTLKTRPMCAIISRLDAAAQFFALLGGNFVYGK